MATWFWVGGSGNWDGSTTTNWAATSGGAGGAGVPVAGDTINFDTNSGTGTVTIASSASAQTVIHNKSTITLTFSADNTSWCIGTYTLTTGIFITANFNLTFGAFSSSNSNARTTTLGSSTLTLTTGGISCSVINNWTITTNTATWILTSAGASVVIGNRGVNGMSFTFTGGGAQTFNYQNSGVGNLTVTGTSALTDSITFSQRLNATGTLTLGGGSTQGASRLFVTSPTIGTQLTLTCSNVVINGDVDFRDIAISNSGSWTNSGNAFMGDCGGNSGITFTTPTTQTATDSTSVNFSAMGWTSRVPLPQDTALISITSGTPTITLDMPRVGTVDCSGTTVKARFGFGTLGVSFYGSFIEAVGMNQSTGTNAASLLGRGNFLFTSTTARTNSWTLNAPGGTYTLGHSCGATPGGSFGWTITQGTFDTGGFNMGYITSMSSNNSNTRAIYLRNSTIDVQGGGVGTSWNFGGTGLTFDAGTSTVKFTGHDGSGPKTAALGGQKYYNFIIPSTEGFNGVITGNNTFSTLDIEAGTNRTITFPANGTQTVTNSLILQGSAGKILSLISSTSGTPTTIAANLGTVSYISPSIDVVLKYRTLMGDRAEASPRNPAVVPRSLANNRTIAT